jgi:two-component system phosphate regulon sensor histidine kinase PhoR
MFLQLTGSTLRDGAQKIIGALLVINDITRIKKLENIRKDFVANVSHELRTPLTSIKGYVETLENGAVDNRDEAMRFLGIVSAQVDRLNTIVEDLLSLSQIEREGENGTIELSSGKIGDVLAAAVEACKSKIELKQIGVTVNCDNDLVAPIEASLLEQAVVNLLDNAIKYSAENKQIWINASVDAQRGEVAIAVRDEGIGIEKQHLDRLFERFYRVDKARSRKLGGTGLGLSIVKHIVAAHGGRVGVESVPAQGSTFFLYLPVSHK